MFKVGDLAVFGDSGTYKNPLLKIVHIPLQKVVIVSNGINGYAEFTHLRHTTPEEIAAGHRIDKSPLMQHLDKCEEVVKTWPKWKLQSVRDALCIPKHTDEVDDSDLEYHVSPLCKIEVK
ncbi:MAG: hypothetical protein RR676_16660 [Acinetobacter sp.]